MKGFPKHKVCVLNTQHVLRGRMKQTVPISLRHTKKRQTHMILVLLLDFFYLFFYTRQKFLKLCRATCTLTCKCSTQHTQQTIAVCAHKHNKSLGISRPSGQLMHYLVSRLLYDPHMSESMHKLQTKLDFNQAGLKKKSPSIYLKYIFEKLNVTPLKTCLVSG